MTRMQQRAACLVAMLALWAGAPMARAGMVTFTFGANDNLLSTISKTVDGITLTLSNPTGASTVFRADGDGLAMGGPDQDFQYQGYRLPTAFNLSVAGATLQLTGYGIGYVEGGSPGSFTMSGGSGTSSGNSVAASGGYTANGNWQLTPGQVGTLALVGYANQSLTQINSLTFSFQDPPAVPEPGTVGLALVGAGLLGVRAWRRRGRRATA